MDGETERRARRVRLVAFDVDGVLTDGSIAYTEKGDEIKSFNAQDGSAIERLIESGIEVALITGRQSPMVERRAGELRIRHLYAGIADKVDALTRLLDTLDLDAPACAYVGDDIPDLAVFRPSGSPSRYRTLSRKYATPPTMSRNGPAATAPPVMSAA